MSKRVLVVEDNEDLRTIVASLLRHFGYESTFARTGSEAIASVISNCPDVVLLDLGLPDMTGHDVARAIFKSSAQHIPIIGCSAYSDGEERENALESGMVDYLQKPVQAEKLKATIEQFLQRGG